MLQKLNERIQGVIAWSVIILVAFTFTLFGIDNYLQSRSTSDAKVIVNDIPISNQEFENNYRRTRQQTESTPSNLSEEKRLQAQVLDEMVKNLVTVESARKYGFEVTENQAEAAIVKIPQFQEDGHFSTEKYRQALNNALYTIQTFQNQVRQGMLLNQQRFAFIGSSFALPNEIERFVKLYMQTRDYDYLRIKPSLFQEKLKTTPEEIQAYYNTHKNEFMTPEQVSLSYIKLSMEELKNSMKVSSEDIKHYYDENVNNYLTPAQWKVAHILFSIPESATKSEVNAIQEKAQKAYDSLAKDPQLFNTLVSTSDDKLSLPVKGELPWITAGQKEYDRLLAELTQPGQISKPQRTKHGFEIFKVLDYKPVATKSLDQVRESIKEQILLDLVQSKYTKSLEQLSDLSYQTPDSLLPVSKALGLPLQKTELFNRSGGNTEITKNKLVINAAFSNDLLNLGNNSEPIQLTNDAVIVLRVNKHLPAVQQPVEVVKEQIQQKLLQQYSEKMAKQLGLRLLELSSKIPEQQKLLKENQLEWQSVIKASRDADEDNMQLNELAFNLLSPNSQQGISLPNGDYVIVLLKKVNQGQLEHLDKEQRDNLEQQIEASFGMMDYDLYVSHLLKEAQVVKN